MGTLSELLFVPEGQVENPLWVGILAWKRPSLGATWQHTDFLVPRRPTWLQVFRLVTWQVKSVTL